MKKIYDVGFIKKFVDPTIRYFFNNFVNDEKQINWPIV